MAKRPAGKAKSKSKAKPAKAAAKKAAKKAVKKPVKKAPKKAAKKPAKKPAKAAVSPALPLELSMDMQNRLKALSMVMNLSLEALMHQALSEFADTWEDHHRTVAALAEPNDRMMVVDKD
jgi:predicted transcriptional regulator